MKEKVNLEQLVGNFSEYFDILRKTKNEILSNFKSRNDILDVMIEDGIIEMTRGRLLVNLYLLKPFTDLLGSTVKISKDDLFNYDVINEDNLISYFNKLIRRINGFSSVSFSDIRTDIYGIINGISDISGELNVLYGNTISFRDFIKMSIEDPEIDELMNKQEVEFGLQFSEIEEKFKNLGKKLIKYFKEHPTLELSPFVAAGTGINIKQLTQCLGFVGLKPDLGGNIIPLAVKDNYLNGMSNIENYIVSCKGCRKSLITNFKLVRKSGYLTRKLSLCCMGTVVNNNIDDCGTKHFIKYSIDSKEKLDMIDGRHYYLLKEDEEKLSENLCTVDSENDSNLIGSVIGLRSPVTCNCKNSGEICRTCYGKVLAEVNKDIHNGLIAVLFLTNPLTQKLLSSKHLLTTSSEKIEWGNEFTDVFDTNMNSIFFSDVESQITIKWEDVKYDESSDDEPFVSEFIISQSGKKPFSFTTPDDIKLYLNERIMNIVERKDEESLDFVINSKSLHEDEALFTFTAKNNELTKSLNQILDLIESTDHLGITDKDEFVNKFAELLITNGLGYINSVHVEMISSNLFRDEETEKRIDFGNDEIKPYSILRVSKCIMNAPLSVSLSFERLNDQFINLQTYEKSNESIMDYLFR